MLQRKQNAVDIMPKEGEDSVAFGSASWAWTDEDANRIEYRGARRMPLLSPMARPRVDHLKHVTATSLPSDDRRMSIPSTSHLQVSVQPSRSGMQRLL
jgi:hypothetical protein